MNIRHYFQKYLYIILFLCIQNGLSIIPDEDYYEEPQFNRCPWIRNKLKNGRVRYRYKGRVAKFLCDSGFELAGKRSATCVRGQWSNPIPVCVARGCMRAPQLTNGRITEMYKGALLAFDCNPGYVLDGNPTIHCDGRRWSASQPLCVIATENPDTNCDFENPDLCGWTHDPNHDFDWTRNQFSTPSGHVGTGPSFDHTFGENKGGFYLYIEASSPRKINDTARIFSPVYHKDLSGGCFTFWYHMYGATTGGLRVYLKPESHVFDELNPNWEKYGNQGNQWIKGHMIVPVLNENFQIIIEGLRGESYVGDSAIDDVRLTSNLCDSDDNTTDITEAVDPHSCRGRCQESGSESSCGCNPSCVDEPNFCCRDYHQICSAGNYTTSQNSEEPLPEDYTTPNVVVSKLPTLTTEVNSTFTKESITEKIESTNTTFSAMSTMLTDASTSSPMNVFTTISSTKSVSPSAFTMSTVKYISSTEPTSTSESSTTASSSTVLTTEASTSPATSSESTSLDTTTLTTTDKLTSILSTLKTTVPSTTPQDTSTTTMTTIPTTNQITTSTTSQATSLPTSTIASTLSSTLKLTTLNISVPLYTPNSTTIKSTSTYTTYINTTSSYAAMSSSTESISSSSTTLSTLSTTRKTYNLRPRNRTSSTEVYTTLPTVSSTTESSLTSYTPLLQSTYSSSFTTSSRYLTSWYRYSASPSTKQQKTPTSTESSTQTFLPKIDTTISYISQTTKFSKQNTKPTKSSLSKTSSAFESNASKTETSSSNSSISVIVSVIVVVLICSVVGIAYYIKKQRSKRQSKLSDDSEMRFLQENDYMEYSDASALDKILVK